MNPEAMILHGVSLYVLSLIENFFISENQKDKLIRLYLETK